MQWRNWVTRRTNADVTCMKMEYVVKRTIKGQLKDGAMFCFAVSTVLAALAASTVAKRLDEPELPRID